MAIAERVGPRPPHSATPPTGIRGARTTYRNLTTGIMAQQDRPVKGNPFLAAAYWGAEPEMAQLVERGEGAQRAGRCDHPQAEGPGDNHDR
jgi:hypothetical protein